MAVDAQTVAGGTESGQRDGLGERRKMGGRGRHRQGREACASRIRQAATSSQVIHTTSRTKAATMAIDSVGENPAEPTTVPCTR